MPGLPGVFEPLFRPQHGSPSLLVRPVVHRTPRIGELVGGYELRLELAEDTRATVYLARASGHTGLPPFVALKCLRPALARDPHFVSMFFDDARLVSQIQHPNVRHVIDFDQIDGVTYQVLEFVAGETLASVRHQLRRHLTELSPEHQAGVVARIIADAAEGLHAAHELRNPSFEPLGIVHRDVSPANIFLTHDGTVKVVFPFGVALDAHRHHGARTGMLKDRYSYLPPEALGGPKLDRRADVWGLGVVMWELLTAQHLFAFDTEARTLRAVCEMQILPPSSVRPGLPVALDAIVLRALERDPAQRYATAREMAEDLLKLMVAQRLAMSYMDLAEFVESLFPIGRAAADAESDSLVKEIQASRWRTLPRPQSLGEIPRLRPEDLRLGAEDDEFDQLESHA